MSGYKTREQYLVIRRLAAKRGAITKKINDLIGSGISIDSIEVKKLLKEDGDLADSIKIAKYCPRCMAD